MKKPELLAPGGSFLSAYYAIEAGADGVYLGMTEFSARKAASNFTFDQLRRIRRLASDRGRTIYVTLNTIIRECELPRLADVVSRLQAAAVDGIIVQDLGVLWFLRRRFPGIPVHASTQMAVHGAAGIGFLKGLGVRRIILSRECTLERIRALRAAHPDVELEVFIHGALCYGFSGICLASSALTDRSGNRGDCAQICRSMFERVDADAARGARKGFFFSCRDLSLGTEVLELARAGVNALKIEGRMKSPEYVFNTVRLYREIIDRDGGIPEDEYRELVRRSDISYAREKTTGFLRERSGSRLINSVHPGHAGAFLGVISEVRGTEVSLGLESDLSIRDGLAIFPQPAPTAPREPFIFSVHRIRASGKDVGFARKGETVTVSVPQPPAGILLQAGLPVRQLSSRFLDLRQPKEASFPLWKVAVDLAVSLREEGGACIMRVDPVQGLPAFMGSGGGERSSVFERPVTLDAAARPRLFSGVLERLFAESGDSLFTAGRVSFTNGTDRRDDGIFVPPSELKRLKNRFYRHLDSWFDSAISHEGEEAAGVPDRAEGPAAAPSAAAVEEWLAPFGGFPVRRAVLSPAECAPIPFTCGEDSGETDAPGRVVPIPLPPVMPEEEPLLRGLRERISASPRTRFLVGLANVAHVAFARELAAPNVRFFVDFPLYVANHWAYGFFLTHVPDLLFQYSWIEGDEGDHALLARALGNGVPLARVEPSFKPPLFYAMGCYARHVLGGGRCAPSCPKEFTETLRQGANGFSVRVKDCVTYLFISGTPPASPTPRSAP